MPAHGGTVCEDGIERREAKQRRLWRDAYLAAPYTSLKTRLQLVVRHGTVYECSRAPPCICTNCEVEKRQLSDVCLYTMALRTSTERQRRAEASWEAEYRQVSDYCLYAVAPRTNTALRLIT